MHEHPEPLNVLDCPVCQREYGALATDVDLHRVWTGVAGQVWALPLTRTERTARRLLHSPALARALVTTPSLVVSWILASAAVLGVGVVFSRGVGAPLVALLAPALAGVGIAYAYGPGTDPAYELASTLPVSDRLVLLVRAVAVFTLNAGLGVAASVLTSQATPITVTWLIPMAALSALALAAATLARSASVGAMTALSSWCVVVLAAESATGRLDAAVAGAALLPASLIVVGLSIAAVVYATRVPAQPKRGSL